MPPKRKKGGGKGHLAYNPGEAFSGQKKKALLQAKREKRRNKDNSDSEGSSDEDLWAALKDKVEFKEDKPKPVVVTSFGGSCGAEGSRLSSLFKREDDEAVAARRSRGEEALKAVVDKKAIVAEEFTPLQNRSVLSQDRLSSHSAGSKLLHPVRPMWHESMSAASLEKQEATYFEQWCEDTFAHIEALGSAGTDVAPFELNLEVWRQLWRVVEHSDVVVLIVDVRNPTFHIPPSLVYDVIVTHGRRLVIALSKCDLVPQAFVRRWQRYLTSRLPNVAVVEFMSRPVNDPPGGERGAGGISARRRWLTRRIRQGDIEAHLNVMAKALMESALGGQPGEIETESKLDAGSKDTATELARDALLEKGLGSDPGSEGEEEIEAADSVLLQAADDAESANGRVVVRVAAEAGSDQLNVGRGPGGALAIGLVGHPNVGKTSVLNALAGRKAASVSATAGHTKHLQHIRVDETVHANAYVIDCPGLVFPSLSPRAQAELNGLLPLAQVRETMSGVRLLAETLSLPKVLGLKMPDWYEEDEPWTPLAILEAYAEKHKYHIPRSGAPDVHRAGLEILKDAKDGAMLLAYEPPS